MSADTWETYSNAWLFKRRLRLMLQLADDPAQRRLAKAELASLGLSLAAARQAASWSPAEVAAWRARQGVRHARRTQR